MLVNKLKNVDLQFDKISFLDLGACLDFELKIN